MALPPIDQDFAKLGNMLLKKYVTDFVAHMKNPPFLWNPYLCLKCSGSKTINKKGRRKQICCPECAGVGVESIPMGELK
jgi:hypothetical protein